MLLAQLLHSLLQPQGGEKGEQAGAWDGCLVASSGAEGEGNRRQREEDLAKRKRDRQHPQRLQVSLMHPNEMT